MLIDFFLRLKSAGIPVTVREFLVLIEALQKGLSFGSVDEFYLLARLCLVKDESHYDKFDRIFAHYFNGAEDPGDEVTGEIPEEWLRKIAERALSDEDKAEIDAMGGFDELMKTLRKRIQEQVDRHQGGNKWVGTAGTSPFGAYGFNPMGVRIGQEHSRNHRATKVWDKREFRNLDNNVELGTRNIKMALRKLRHFAREGAPEELDLPGTVKSTADNAGYLDLKMVAKYHNKVKVLLFLDVGGSMDVHVKACEELFSAASTEFKHLEFFYFHNFIYEKVWRDNRRRTNETFSFWDVLHTFGPDYKVIVVGDASMSPHEITMRGGSVEHYNDEPGTNWLSRLLQHYQKTVWLNPLPTDEWKYGQSIQMTNRLMEGRMYPLTLEGLDQAIGLLSGKHSV
jgi:uncharacterized protein with von Willebrand factor type A (vWA) domain